MQSESDPIVAWIGLCSVPGVGRATFRKLVERFGSPEAAFAASQDELKSVAGLPAKTIQSIKSFPWQKHGEQEIDKARKAGVSIIKASDDAFPKNLQTAADAPLFLYVKGSIRPEDSTAIAVVGTRTPTHYGLSVTSKLASELASAGCTIVSGMARGIDTQAHKGALAAGGRTIAVLGCGIDIVYPPENRDLMERIAENGAVVTENPFGTKPESGYFPARNRIISGLALGTVIVEAAEDSGSLITADYTRKQGRILFAVPGNIGSPTSKGTNTLIRQGAILIETAGDVLRMIGKHEQQKQHRMLPPLSDKEKRIYEALTSEPKHIDKVAAECRCTPGMTGSLLTALELKGLVRQMPGKYFIKEQQ